jgi:putative ABC transport system permease protein
MLKNFIKIAWRNITRKPFFSLVNITGLSAGIAFTLLIAAYVWKELQVNTQLKNSDRQYIIQSKWKDPNEGYELASVGPLAKALRENYPHLVANYYRYDGITSNVSRGDRNFRENLQVCDTTMFTMYGFSLLHGDVKSAFEGPYSVVITKEKAVKYFGRADVVGQNITIENFAGSKHDFQITGVLKPYAQNSATQLTEDYPSDLFISEKNLAYFGRNMDWNNTSIASYIELQKGVKPSDLDRPMKDLLRSNTNAQISADLTPYLLSLKEYYLSSNNGLVRKMLYALSAIALFILGMAIINFVNMTVSRSATRMREIGVRKVMGGLRKQLIIQFLTESILLVFCATILAFGIYLLAKDFFSGIVGKDMPSLLDFPLYFILLPVAFIFITGLIAGIYPAFVLSSLKSVDSLKGKLNGVKEKVWLRKLLVAIQFGTATIVFVGAIIISRQVNHFFGKNLGYNKDYVVAAQVPRDWTSAGVTRMESIRKQLADMPGVADVSLSFEIPNGNNGGNSPVYVAGQDSASAISALILYADEYYATTYGIPMAAGEFFSKPGAYTDSSSIVINETQSKALGFKSPQAAINAQIKFPGSTLVFNVAGVTKDFHFGSMQKSIPSLTFVHVGSSAIFRFLSLKLRPGNIGKSLGEIQRKWASLMPGAPFEYKFMDETLARLYKSEIQLRRASYTATVLSLVIVLLGVIGLVALSVQKRTREVGIRKVLGASISSILGLFLKEFLVIISIAGIIACPIAYLIMNSWLSDYASRIPITAGPFGVAIAGLLAVTGLLIIVQTIKAGLANPVKSLRTD